MDTAQSAARAGSTWIDRAFARAIVIAFFLHLPLMPSRLFDWVRVALFHQMGDYDDRDAQVIVPIDLDLLASDPVAEAPAPAPPTDPGAAPKDAALDGGAPPPPADAGTPVDAGSDAAAPKPAAPPPPADAGPSDAGPPAPTPLRDPMAAAGGAGKIAAKDPNVQLLLSGRAMRKHPMGPFFSRLLLMIPEWKQFFQGTPIDPIKDLDHLLITAPRLVGDSAKLVAIMGVNVPAEQIREAVDQIVHRANGVWLEDAPVTTARARVLGSPRLFALLPQKKLLVILPGEAQDQLEKLKQAKPFRASSEALVVSLLTPARPFRGFINLPSSLKWARIAVTPTADGGADIAIDVGDASAAEAERHAADLTQEIERRRKIDLGLIVMEIIDPVRFEAAGETIRARTHISKQKLGQIMAFIQQQAEARFEPRPAAGR